LALDSKNTIGYSQRMTLEIYTDDSTHSAICREYWQIGGDGAFSKTISEIAKTYKMTTTEVNKIVKANCAFFSPHIFCEACEEPYQFEGRTDFTSKALREKWTCQDCKTHIATTALEAKHNCVTRHAQAALSKPIDPYTMSARQLVSLAALSRFGADESLTYIHAFDSIRDNELTPSTEYSIAIIKELYSSKLLIVSPNSDLGRITLNENGGYSFYMSEVEFLLPHPNPAGFITAIEEDLLTPGFFEEHKAELEFLAQEIALQECLAFLERVLMEHQLQYSPGEKTFLVLNKGLESYSVAQMCNFIWRAAKDAAAFYIRNRVSRDHAAKTVVGSIERQIERASANGWSVTAYRRNYDHPQSVLSRTLYNTVLKTDDGGFSKRISDLFQMPTRPPAVDDSMSSPDAPDNLH
jgi:hypothetical protein